MPAFGAGAGLPFYYVDGLSAFTAPLCQRLAEALNLPYILSVHHFQTGRALRTLQLIRFLKVPND